ncbi:MAG: hypothetical protein ACRDGI_08290 [Candidatus Limnocylindrales bacterium]
MRLSGWRTKAPGRDGINQKALDAVGAILGALGADVDPHCWVTWGDETGSRWSLMAPCPAGLAVVNVRAGGPGEGSRASGRLIRWSKVQLGELAAESERGHRLVMFQVEGQPIRGTDDEADLVAAFAGLALAGVEGRPLPDLDGGARRAPTTKLVTPAKPDSKAVSAPGNHPGGGTTAP